MSWTQTCFGLGYMLGPGVGAWFYEMGGFMLPFLVVGSLSTILSLLLVVTIPNVGGSGIVTFEILCQANRKHRIQQSALVWIFSELFCAVAPKKRRKRECLS